MNNEYWDKFYATPHITEPTSFAKFCLPYIITKKKIYDLGSGNGRDSFFFHKVGFDVVAVDQSHVAINKIKELNGYNIKTIECNMALLKIDDVDVVYSRFSLHSITQDEQDKVLQWSKNNLKKSGIICIEVRSDKDKFKGDHYRRFLNFNDLKKDLISCKFDIIFEKESKGFAPFKNEDPLIIRIIGEKL